MRAVISKPAILNIILSAIEVYKKETYGILLGQKSGKNIKIMNAVTFQSTTRDYDYVSLDKARENRINLTLKYVTNMKVMGDFHSHADFPEKLSSHDTEELRKMGSNIVSVLVLVKRASSSKKWAYDGRNRRIAGTIAGKYFVSITASVYNYKTERPERIPVSCLHLGEINKRMRQYADLEKKLKKLEKIEKRNKRIKKLLRAKKMRL